MTDIIPVIVVSYLLGSLPIAYQVSLRRGVDLFATGTRLSGSTNVLRSVGKLPGLIVLIWDMTKGVLSVFMSNMIGLDAPMVLLPVSAVLIGHWKPIFTRFRGGDGIATLGGATIAMYPIFGPICIGVAILVSLGGQKLPYSSLISIVFGYLTLVILTISSNSTTNTVLTTGIGLLASIVLLHAINGHRQRRQ